MSADLEHTVEQWAARIRPHLARAVEGIIAAGRELIAAKEALPHGSWGSLCEAAGLNPRTAQRFMKVAQHPVLSDPTHGSHLPPSWRALDELTRVPEEALLDAIESGEVNSSTTRKQALQLAARSKDPVEWPHAEAREGRADAVQRARRFFDDGDYDAAAAMATFAANQPDEDDLTDLERHEAAIEAAMGQLWEVAVRLDFDPDAPLEIFVDQLLSFMDDRRKCCGWRVHPALAAFPPMTETERAGLVESIRKHGLLVPVVTWRGQLLDGRERLMACEAVGVEPTFREWEGRDPVAFVWSANYCRQSLTPGQIAAVQTKADAEL